jgi:hypothetical protein
MPLFKESPPSPAKVEHAGDAADKADEGGKWFMISIIPVF